MHIQPLHEPEKTHRHLLAAPLCALFLVAPWLTGSTASVIPVPSAAESSAGGNVLLGEDSSLVAARGTVSLRADGLRMYGLAGAFHVTRLGQQVTVAALTTPVVIDTDDASLLVPAGYQWRSRALVSAKDGWDAWADARRVEPVPAAFLREQLPLIDDLLQASQEPGIDAPADLPERPSAWLRLSLAQERADALWKEQAIGVLQRHVREGDRDGFLAVLNRADVTEAYREDPSIAALLLAETNDEALEREIVLPVVSHPVFGIIALFHPSLRARAWLAPLPDAADDSAALRALRLPAADMDADGLPASAVAMWRDAVAALLRELPDAPSFAALLLQESLPVLQRADRLGYPERARRYRDALLALTEPFESRLDAEGRELRQAFASLGHGTIIADAPAPASSAASSAPPAHAMAAEEGEQTVMALLRQAGASFTVHTRVEAQDGGWVMVESVLFSDGQHDALYDFAVDPVHHQVQRLRRDGQPLPYALPWDAFIEWATGAQKAEG